MLSEGRLHPHRHHFKGGLACHHKNFTHSHSRSSGSGWQSFRNNNNNQASVINFVTVTIWKNFPNRITVNLHFGEHLCRLRHKRWFIMALGHIFSLCLPINKWSSVREMHDCALERIHPTLDKQISSFLFLFLRKREWWSTTIGHQMCRKRLRQSLTMIFGFSWPVRLVT